MCALLIEAVGDESIKKDQKSFINRVAQNVFFCVWLIPPRVMLVRLLSVLLSVCSLSLHCSATLYEYTTIY